jgi:hypothetical protein
VRTGDEVSQRVGSDTGEPNEHTRVVQVVFLQVIGTGIILDERVSLSEVHHHDERIRLGGPMGRDTHEHLAPHLQRGLAPGRCHLYIWQGTTDGFDGSERVATWHRRYATLSYVLADLLASTSLMSVWSFAWSGRDSSLATIATHDAEARRSIAINGRTLSGVTRRADARLEPGR